MYILQTESFLEKDKSIDGISVPVFYYSEHLNKCYDAIFTLLSKYYGEFEILDSYDESAPLSKSTDYVFWLNGIEDNLDARDADIVEDTVRVCMYDAEKGRHVCICELRVRKADSISVLNRALST